MKKTEQIKNDIEFLSKMKEHTQSLLNTGYDATRVQALDKMIEDWRDELQGTLNALSKTI